MQSRERRLLCRFLDAGNNETLRPLRRPASKKRRGTKSREGWRRLGGERYGDLILAPAMMAGAKLGPGDVDVSVRAGLEACNGRFGDGVSRINGRSAG